MYGRLRTIRLCVPLLVILSGRLALHSAAGATAHAGGTAAAHTTGASHTGTAALCLLHYPTGLVGTLMELVGFLLGLAGMLALRVGIVGMGAAEYVEFVDDMEHAIGVEGHVPGVATHRGVDGAGDVALLTENVVELQHDGERLAFEE